MLPIYDAYRSHLGFKVLINLKDGGVIAYRLPAHTSVTTQPLEGGVFSPLKSILNDLIYSVASRENPWSKTNLTLLAFSQMRCKGRSQKRTSRQRSKDLAYGRSVC